MLGLYLKIFASINLQCQGIYSNTSLIRTSRSFNNIYVYVSFSDPEVRIPLTWPVGTYGLPMPKSGCPKGITFPWHVGTRYHDTEDGSANNRWSTPYHLAGKVSKSNMEQKFCMKTQRTFGISWPKGKYCILKKGPCPQGQRIVVI